MHVCAGIWRSKGDPDSAVWAAARCLLTYGDAAACLRAGSSAALPKSGQRELVCRCLNSLLLCHFYVAFICYSQTCVCDCCSCLTKPAQQMVPGRGHQQLPRWMNQVSSSKLLTSFLVVCSSFNERHIFHYKKTNVQDPPWHTETNMHSLPGRWVCRLVNDSKPYKR